MHAPRHRVKVRLGGRLAAGLASLLTLAASVSAASAAVKNPPIHQSSRSAAAGATTGSSRVRGAVGRARLRGVRLLVPGGGSDTPGGSAAVRRLQRRLSGAGWAPGPIDGRYGPLTAQAVKRFQAAHGLAVDGISGPQTLAALTAPVPVLFPGAGEQQPHGSPSVRALQRRLARAGWAPGPIDGRYGRLTARAVERFQAGHGLRVDGIVGSHTWRALVLMARAAAGRAPRERPVSLTRPAPSGRPRPQASGVQRRAPGLPVGLVLLGLAAIGLLTGTLGYARARRALANQRQGRAQRSSGLARPMWHARNGGLVASSNREGER